MRRKNKKGWIRIVEAFLAVLIVMGAVVIIMARQPVQSSADNQIYERQTQILEIIRNNNSLRSNILDGKTYNVDDIIVAMIPSSWNFTTSICDINDICSANVPLGKDIYTKEIIISSNLTLYSTKKLRFSVWMR